MYLKPCQCVFANMNIWHCGCNWSFYLVETVVQFVVCSDSLMSSFWICLICIETKLRSNGVFWHQQSYKLWRALRCYYFMLLLHLFPSPMPSWNITLKYLLDGTSLCPSHKSCTSNQYIRFYLFPIHYLPLSQNEAF